MGWPHCVHTHPPHTHPQPHRHLRHTQTYAQHHYTHAHTHTKPQRQDAPKKIQQTPQIHTSLHTLTCTPTSQKPLSLPTFRGWVDRALGADSQAWSAGASGHTLGNPAPGPPQMPPHRLPSSPGPHPGAADGGGAGGGGTMGQWCWSHYHTPTPSPEDSPCRQLSGEG